MPVLSVFSLSFSPLYLHTFISSVYEKYTIGDLARSRVFLKALPRPVIFSVGFSSESGYLLLHEFRVVHLIPHGTRRAGALRQGNRKAFESRLRIWTAIFPSQHLHTPRITGFWGDYWQGKRGYRFWKLFIFTYGERTTHTDIHEFHFHIHLGLILIIEFVHSFFMPHSHYDLGPIHNTILASHPHINSVLSHKKNKDFSKQF